MWWTGILSGLIGGAIAIAAGALNDTRLSRRQDRDKIKQLAAVVTATTSKMIDIVNEVQVRRLEDHNAPGLNWTVMHDYECEYTAAYIELSWFIKRSPMWPLVEESDHQRGLVISRWSEPSHAKWALLETTARSQLQIFEGAVEYFTRLTPGQARDYLNSTHLPEPATVGARPLSLKRGRFRKDFP